MRSCCLNDEQGLTLVELLVALGLTGLVLVLVVTGSLFVQKFISDWSDRDKVTEELAFLNRELTPRIEESHSVEIRGDTVNFGYVGEVRTVYMLDSGGLSRDGRVLSRAGLNVETVEIAVLDLQNPALEDTLKTEERPRGLYQLKLVVSDKRGNRDSLLTVVRNDYEYFKYSQK